MHRQPPAIGERLVAERVEQLRIQHRGDEIERRIGVGYDAKQRGLAIAHLVQRHLVVGHELTDLLNVERREARAAGDQDALHRLRGGVFDLFILAGCEVIRLFLRELLKQQIDGGLVALVILAHLAGVDQLQQRDEISLLLRRFKRDVADQRHVE